MLFVVDMMATGLLCRVGARTLQALRVCGPNGVTMGCSMALGVGVPTDDEQMTGLEKEVMTAAWKGLNLYDNASPLWQL